jgi:DNA-binding CsgD family transcriptional regulator
MEVARFLLHDAGAGDAAAELELPPNLQAFVHARLSRLPKAVLKAIEPASLLADPTIPVLEAVSSEPEDVGEWLDRAQAADVIAVSGDRVRFTHPLLAEGVAEMIGPRRRIELHRRLAALIDEPEERARHLALATNRPDSVVADAVEDGAQSALHRGATAAAADLYERAAVLTPSGERSRGWRRTIEAARASHDAGLRDRGRRLVIDCLAELPPGEDRADALLVLARLSSDDLQVAMRALDEAVDLATDDALLSAIHRERESAWFLATCDIPAALAEANASLEAAERSGDEGLLVSALSEVSLLETMAGSVTPGRLERAIATRGDAAFDGFSPTFVQGMRYLYVDRVDEARAILEAELADAERREDDPTYSNILIWLTELECRAGNFDAAVERAAECWLRQEQRGEAFQGGAALYARALAETCAGLAEDARSSAERGIALSVQVGDLMFETLNRSVLGLLEISLGDVVAADRVLRPLPAWLVDHGWIEPCLCQAWPNAIEALVALGEVPLARSYLDLFQSRAQRCDCPWALATSARCLGLLRAAEGDNEEAFEAFEQALVEHRRTPGPFERGRTLLSYGVALRRAKRRGEARARMEEARGVFDEIGARLWAARARDELARVGGRQRSGPELTPTEERIARLVAGGASNAEVAADLFVTVRTVESNLTRIYAKLGLKSRTELAARFQATEAASP